MFVRIITKTAFSELVPYWYDALVALGGIYGGGLLLVGLLKSKLVLSNIFDKAIFAFIGIHLTAAAFGHIFFILVQNHQILDIIPIQIVYILFLSMILLTFYSLRIKVLHGSSKRV